MNFRNTIIIMTSNIGSHYLLEGVTDKGEIKPYVKEQVMQELRRHFKPEFLNRVDEIVMFKPLTLDEVEKIVLLLIKDLAKRLEERHMKIEISDEARRFIAESGYDPVYGARPLRRFIQREIETPIAKLIISGQALDGATIRVDLVDGKLHITAENSLEEGEERYAQAKF